MTVRINLTDPALSVIASAFGAAGAQIRVVGGAVRDMLLGLDPKDIDLATSATPEEVIEIASSNGLRTVQTGLRHGTVSILVAGSLYEVTTLRKDVETDGRHATVAFVRDFEVDAARRDFTINAMSADLDGQVHDYFGGMADLKRGELRFVGNPHDRITEDFLRILRLFRFRARFAGDANLPADLAAAVREHAPGLRRISGERIWQEMSKLIQHPSGSREIALMSSLGVTTSIDIDPRATSIVEAARVISNGGSAAAALGVLAGNEVAVAANLWRLSNAEAEDAVLASEIARSPLSDPLHWMCAVADGASAAVVWPVLKATGRHEAAAAVMAGVPDFPIRGRDLLDAGHVAGPDLGRKLREMKESWKASCFTLDRDELLASVEASGPSFGS